MDIEVIAADRLLWRGREYRCAVGRGGLGPKLREGDGVTPVGRFPLRRVFFRPDRIARPETRLPIKPLNADDGWCDDTADPAYNRLVRRPFASSHEIMWRDDHVYDLVVEVGYNDSPPIPGLGSAIFMHLARPDFSPTAGCVALAAADLLKILSECDDETELSIRP